MLITGKSLLNSIKNSLLFQFLRSLGFENNFFSFSIISYTIILPFTKPILAASSHSSTIFENINSKTSLINNIRKAEMKNKCTHF